LGLQYAANHPPLYYLMLTPLYWLTDQQSAAVQQFLLRLGAIPFGMATVVLAYLLARALFPGDGFLGVTVPSFIAFQPQISYEAAMVNNDIVAIALFSLILYLLTTGLRDRFPRRTCLLIGVAFGLAMLTKGTSQIAAPIIGVAIVIGTGWRDVRGWVTRGLLAAVPAALLVAPWYVFLYRTYGNLSGLPQIERIQWWNRPAGGFFELLIDRDFVFMRFKETWGEFGWRLIHFDTVMHWAIALPLIVAFGGVVQYALTAGRATTDPADDPVMRPARWQVWGLLVLAITCAVAYLAVVQFGTRFLLTQARYYFPAMNAAALLLMLGMRTLIPRSYHPYGQAAIVGGLLLLNLMIFTQYVIPYWQLRG
jgi:4-amino-4-deoxy-L-arabinose transferase-like glycosyltransferase